MNDRFIRKLLFALPPETAHRLAVAALRWGVVPAAPCVPPACLRISAFGLQFASPLGMAAGFDKRAEAFNGLLAQGFGFVETGTVTPLPQAGNPRPRIFRLAEDEAIINRLGFNSCGKEAFVAHLRAPRRRAGVVGANVGKNRDSVDAIADYVTLLKAVSPYADYVTVNVSSPNTAGLRALQERESLDALLAALMETRAGFARPVPLLLKIAPDLEAVEREAIAEVALARRIDGLIVSNTTIARPASLKSALRNEQGGLSGRPLLGPSTDALRAMHRLTGGRLTLIGVGGIFSAGDAYAKIRAGATLLQLYTGVVYRGFGLLREIHEGLAQRLERDGFQNIADAVGADNIFGAGIDV